MAQIERLSGVRSMPDVCLPQTFLHFILWAIIYPILLVSLSLGGAIGNVLRFATAVDWVSMGSGLLKVFRRTAVEKIMKTTKTFLPLTL